jgi:hypothetical protein
MVGRLLKAQNRHPFRLPHLHVLIVKEGFKVLISQVYNSADPHIADAQFGRHTRDYWRLCQARRGSSERGRRRRAARA